MSLGAGFEIYSVTLLPFFVSLLPVFIGKCDPPSSCSCHDASAVLWTLPQEPEAK